MSQYLGSDDGGERAKYPLLADGLRTRDGFIASVNVRSGFNPFLFAVIGAGLLLMVPQYYLNKPDDYFGPSVPLWKAMLWCGPVDNGPNISTIVMSWLALAMIIVGVAVVLVRHLTVPRDTEQLYQQYMQDGFLVELLPTSIVVMHGRAMLPLFLFGLPTTSEETMRAVGERLRADMKASRLFVFKLSRLTWSRRVRGRALSLADASLPADVFAAAVIGYPAYDKPRVGIREGDNVWLYTLKRDVSLA